MFLETWSGSFASLLSLVRVGGSRHEEGEGGSQDEMWERVHEVFHI